MLFVQVICHFYNLIRLFLCPILVTEPFHHCTFKLINKTSEHDDSTLAHTFEMFEKAWSSILASYSSLGTLKIILVVDELVLNQLRYIVLDTNNDLIELQIFWLC